MNIRMNMAGTSRANGIEEARMIQINVYKGKKIKVCNKSHIMISILFIAGWYQTGIKSKKHEII